MSNSSNESNATSGRARSEGSREGGQGRSRNRSRNRNRGNRRDENRREGGENRNRQSQGQGRQTGGAVGRQPRRSSDRPLRPVPLSWWQKVLVKLGLGKLAGVVSPAPQDDKRKQERATRQERAPREERQPRQERQPREERAERGERGERRQRGGNRAERQEATSTRIYLGNLSYDATESDLEDLFKGVGAVRKVEIVYNKATHRSKGYGFVDMAHLDEAKRAIEVLHDQFFMGRKLIVSGAKTRPDDAEDADEKALAAREAAEAAAAAPAAVATSEACCAEPAAAEPAEEPASCCASGTCDAERKEESAA